MKNQAYFAVSPMLSGMAKHPTRVNATPKYPQNIHGRALPIRECVRSMSTPKNRSDSPSKSFDRRMRVPMIPGFIPAVSVR